jgi:hypothetical protein
MSFMEGKESITKELTSIICANVSNCKYAGPRMFRCRSGLLCVIIYGYEELSTNTDLFSTANCRYLVTQAWFENPAPT